MEKHSKKLHMNTTPVTETGSSLWTSSPKDWKRLQLNQTDIDQVLEQNIDSLKKVSTDLKQRIDSFKNPIRPDLLSKVVG